MGKTVVGFFSPAQLRVCTNRTWRIFHCNGKVLMCQEHFFELYDMQVAKVTVVHNFAFHVDINLRTLGRHTMSSPCLLRYKCCMSGQHSGSPAE